MCYLFGTGEYHESVGLIFTQAAQDGVYANDILLYQMNGTLIVDKVHTLEGHSPNVQGLR